MGGVESFTACDQLEFDWLPSFECPKTIHFYGRIVREDIFTFIVRQNETKTLGVVKPLYDTFWHDDTFLLFDELR